MTTPEFSPAERLIVRELSTGASNKVIANRLGLAEGTVKVHLKTILRKTGAANRTQAVIKLFYRTYAQDRADAAMQQEFSGPLVLQTWHDTTHHAHA